MKYMLTALALLAATPAMAADKMTVLLDWFINPDHGPIIIAEENGYFAEQGLEVEIIPPQILPPRRVWWPPVRQIWQCHTSRSCICRSTKGCR